MANDKWDTIFDPRLVEYLQGLTPGAEITLVNAGLPCVFVGLNGRHVLVHPRVENTEGRVLVYAVLMSAVRVPKPEPVPTAIPGAVYRLLGTELLYIAGVTGTWLYLTLRGRGPAGDSLMRYDPVRHVLHEEGS